MQFIPRAFRPVLLDEDGSLARHTWELALAVGVRDALRSGGLYLPESRRHVSFWNLVYDEQRWAEQREQAYGELALPKEADGVLERLSQEFEETVRAPGSETTVVTTKRANFPPRCKSEASCGSPAQPPRRPSPPAAARTNPPPFETLQYHLPLNQPPQSLELLYRLCYHARRRSCRTGWGVGKPEAEQS